MSKHTPGPWTLNKKFLAPVVGYDVKDGGDLLPIVEQVHGYDQRQAKANARLIAAAPEILDCLRLIIRRWEFDVSEDDLPSAVITARAVIRKATGGAP